MEAIASLPAQLSLAGEVLEATMTIRPKILLAALGLGIGVTLPLAAIQDHSSSTSSYETSTHRSYPHSDW